MGYSPAYHSDHLRGLGAFRLRHARLISLGWLVPLDIFRTFCLAIGYCSVEVWVPVGLDMMTTPSLQLLG